MPEEQGRPAGQNRPPQDRPQGGGRPPGGDRGPRPGGDRGDRGPRPGGDRGNDRGGDRGDRGGRFDGPPEIDLDKLMNDSLYLDNQAHGIVTRMRDMDSGTRSQL